MEVTIDRKKYQVETTEFTQHFIDEYCKLHMLNDLPLYERLSGMVRDLLPVLIPKTEIGFVKTTHGGFFPIQASLHYEKVVLFETTETHTKNCLVNRERHKISNMFLEESLKNYTGKENLGMLCYECSDDLHLPHQIFLEEHPIPVLIMEDKGEEDLFGEHYITLCIGNSSSKLFIPKTIWDTFLGEFHYFLNDEQTNLNYDNLIHLCIMVKNGGEQFEQMLKDNMHLIDRWTIMDTGSTDKTKEYVERVLVGKKKGNLIEMPFENFRDNRNRLLDAAGELCKFTLMLDDTYVITGDLRGFLNQIRGDQFADSLSIFIKSDDMEYGSNRVLKTYRKLRYLYKIHEVIDPNKNCNVIIPMEKAHVMDRRFDYMEKRTMDRKELDIRLLKEELEDDPENPRTYYYLAQTYNLLKNYEEAFNWFKKRVEHSKPGFIQEKVDAAFEMSRIANFRLKRPWEECMAYYNQCYELDKSRPEAMYFIGMHYYLENDFKTAFTYLKKAFEIGYPIHCQYSLKPTLSFYFCPKFLTTLSYEFKDFELGMKATKLFLQHNNEKSEGFQEVSSWNKIYSILNKPISVPKIPRPNPYNKPLLVFIADGNWKPWSGRTLEQEGLGGSETYIVEMARNIQKLGYFQVFVFCNCSEEGEIEGVIYQSIQSLNQFMFTNYIHSCIISRFSEYLPLIYESFTDNVYLVAHDLTPSLPIFPIDYSKLRKVFCLTEWHVDHMNKQFTILKDYTTPLYYGVDQSLFIPKEKIPYKFIYSSFPNRGLLIILQMWSAIRMIQPKASLHLYCDLNHQWTNNAYPQMMIEIKNLMRQLEDCNIVYHGWSSKKQLAEGWKTADIWFYPCIFQETFCLTALEAAISKTFVVTNDLAALQNTVGDRGIIIKGDPLTMEWKKKALEELSPYLRDNREYSVEKTKATLIKKNYDWAQNLSWENQAKKLTNDFLMKEKYEYKCVFNWSKDIFRGSKELLTKVIQFFVQRNPTKNPRVLEIGAYTGTSLIHIIEKIPNSTGIGVDAWKNYHVNKTNWSKVVKEIQAEQSFYTNVEKAGLQQRIKGLKSDSTQALINFLKEGHTFDFIWVDGSLDLLDINTDLVLSWSVLKQHGVIGVNNIAYQKDENMLESPHEAIQHFLKKYKDQYLILYQGNHHIFVQKL